MASRNVTLILDGTPTIDGYSMALDGFRDLLLAIARQVAPNIQVEWEVETLEATSAVTTLRGVAEESSAVERIAEEYLSVGRQLRSRPFVLGYEAPTRRLRGVLNGRVPAIRFETADDDVTVSTTDAAPETSTALRTIVAYGAVEGRVQTLSNRGGLRFTLYDLMYDKAVSCYLAEGLDDIMRDVWGRVTLVEGLVKRDPVSGRPTAVRQVSRVTIREEALMGAWRAAQGVLGGLTDERAEASIRRLRDAQ